MLYERYFLCNLLKVLVRKRDKLSHIVLSLVRATLAVAFIIYNNLIVLKSPTVSIRKTRRFVLSDFGFIYRINLDTLNNNYYNNRKESSKRSFGMNKSQNSGKTIRIFKRQKPIDFRK